MFCGNCGKEISEDAKFCPHCGAVTGAAPQPAAPGAPVSQAAVPQPTAPGAPVSQSAVPQPTAPQAPVSQDAVPQPTAPGAFVSQAAAPQVRPVSKKTLWALLIGAVSALVLIAVAAVVVMSGLFSSPLEKVERAFVKTYSAYQAAGDRLDLPDWKKIQEERSRSVQASLVLKEINEQLVGYDLSDLSGLGLRLSSDYSYEDRKLGAQLSAFWDESEIASLQVLADDANLYLGSPQFTGDTFLGLNTETMGSTLAELTYEDSLEEIGFNLFDILDTLTPEVEEEDGGQAFDAANKALLEALLVEKTGSPTMEINGQSVKTTAYRVVLPNSALENYIDALAEAASSVNYIDQYEKLCAAMGMPQDEIDDILSHMSTRDPFGDLAESLKDLVGELGDVELDVYLSGGYVSAVIYEKSIEGSEAAVRLYLGGKGEYVDNFSLELQFGDAELSLESAGNHSAQDGSFTDETTLRVQEGGVNLGRLTSEMDYQINSGDFHWEIGMDDASSNIGSLEMEGVLKTSKDSLELDLEDFTVRGMGMELFTLGVEYSSLPYQGESISVNSSVMLADMDENDMMDIVYDIRENAEVWLTDMRDLLGSRLSESLLRSLMYAF